MYIIWNFSGIIWWPISDSANDFWLFIFEPNSILIMLKNEKQPMHGQWGSNTSMLLIKHNEFEEWKCNLLEEKMSNHISFFSCYVVGPPLGMDYEVHAIMEQVIIGVYRHNTKGSEGLFPTAADPLDPRFKLYTACQGNGRYSNNWCGYSFSTYTSIIYRQ